MRIFIDTNVLIDLVADRQGFAEDAERIFALAVAGKIKLMTSALSIVTAMYVAHKYGYENVRESLKAISGFVEILDLKSQTVCDMLSSDWTDYEDATQNQTAINAKADFIVTRNKKDFVKSALPVYAPNEVLDVLFT